MIDVLTLIVFFFSVVTVLYVLKLNIIHNKTTVNSSIEEESEFDDNNSEFEKGDMDKDVDEMPDDCLIYDDLFGEN
jgi:hypothetical protein